MARSPYLTVHPPTALTSLVAALVLVPVLALMMKALVEGTTRFTYTIHWFETVPVIVLAFAFVVNGLLNERRRGAGEAQDKEGPGPGE